MASEIMRGVGRKPVRAVQAPRIQDLLLHGGLGPVGVCLPVDGWDSRSPLDSDVAVTQLRSPPFSPKGLRWP